MTAKKAQSTKKNIRPKIHIFSSRLAGFFKVQYTQIKTKQKKYLSRRPHRSFKLTRKRDYTRSTGLPGYWAFTWYVRKVLQTEQWLFIKFIALFSILIALTIGLMSQESFKLLNDTVTQVGEGVTNGDISGFTQNLAISVGVITGAFNAPLSDSQRIYAGIILLLGWMTMVWLLRQQLAGYEKLRLRDGLYSSGSPFVSTFLIVMLLFVQLIPLALAIIAYVAAESVYIFDDVLFTTFFWIIEAILVTLSLYWLTSTFLALVIVTLPGMYPYKAIKAAGDLVLGRRVRILFRLFWMIGIVLTIWIAFLVPAIAFVNVVNIPWLPLVPLVVLVLSVWSLQWCSAYIYLLYRKLVEDGSSPA